MGRELLRPLSPLGFIVARGRDEANQYAPVLLAKDQTGKLLRAAEVFA